MHISKLGVVGKNLNSLVTRIHTFSHRMSLWPVSWPYRVFKFAISGPTYFETSAKARPKAFEIFFVKWIIKNIIYFSWKLKLISKLQNITVWKSLPSNSTCSVLVRISMDKSELWPSNNKFLSGYCYWLQSSFWHQRNSYSLRNLSGLLLESADPPK